MTLHVKRRVSGPGSPTGALAFIAHPSTATVEESDDATFTAAWVNGTGPFTVNGQFWNASAGQWNNFADTTTVSRAATVTFYAGAPYNSPRRVRIRVVDSLGAEIISNEAIMTATGPAIVVPPAVSGRFWLMSDFAYPAAPAAGTTVNGALVVVVANRTQLNAALGNNRYIVLEDGNYQDAARLNLDSRTNLTLHARNRLGARFEFAAYNQNNCIHLTRSNGVVFRGITLKRPQFYGIRLGSDPGFGDPRGANRNVLIEHCRFTDTAAGQLKIDNGGTSASGITEGVEVRYCTFDTPGQSPGSGLESFCEGVYMGSGDSLCHTNRVRDVNIHHNIFDGSGMGSSGSGEAIEAKVYCSDIRIADNLFIQWKTGQSTSGGAIAISVNTGSNLTGGIIPSAGTRGMQSYLIERNRIYGTRTSASWSAGNGIVIGHGNCTVRNNLIWGSTHAAIRFMQKNTDANGVFSNPAELGVNIHQNTCVGNGSVYSVDFLSAPSTAQVSSRNNAFQGGSSYPTSGVNWTAQQDLWNLSVGAVASGSFTGTQEHASGGYGYGLRPISDGVMVTTVDAGVTDDALGGSRPSGSRQFGAIEARIA